MWTPSFLADFPRAADALRFASQAHGEQRRAVDNAPFLVHPLEVAMLLANRGASEDVISAAILHDAIEDAGVPAAEVERRFGAAIARLVQDVSEERSIADYAARKAALRRQVAAAGEEAALIFAADNVCKVRELRAQTGGDPARFGPASADPATRARIEHYRRSLEMLETVLPAHPLVRQLRFELEALRELRP